MKRGWFGLLVTLAVVIMACNFPNSTSTSSSSDEGALQTAAALTVEAILQATQAAHNGTVTVSMTTPSATAPVQPTAPPPTTQPPPPTATPVPSPTPSPEPCNRATFIKDVTVPDGTVFAPGESFTKVWRLKNVGTCAWQNYSLVFDHGEAMGGPVSKPIPGPVLPGQTVDVSVDLTAPSTPGTYRGYWRLRDDKGVIFGLTNGSAFWVEIKVVQHTATPSVTPSPTPALPPPALVVLDFYAQAPSATWKNGSGVTLPFPGAANDNRGFARYADGLILEDGKSYSRVLETHPEWKIDGWISGTYPTVTLPANSHFRAKIGFIAKADGSCGGGSVKFRLLMGTGPYVVLGSWQKSCTGALQSVDVDLSSYAGSSVTFILQVMADGSSAQDWAVWVNPQVTTP